MASLLLLLLLVLLVGVPAFAYLKKPAALGLTSLVPPLLFQLGNWMYLGYLDPFWPIALVVSSAIALVAALTVGLLMGRFAHQR
jgi:hypothetical protein